jgi:hypothetical protein
MGTPNKFVITLLLMLTGCAPSAKELAAKAEIDRQSVQDRLAGAEVVNCTRKYPKFGENNEFPALLFRCILNAYDNYYNRPDDLYYSLARKGAVLADDLYIGKISRPEFQSELANFEVQINNIRLQRKYAQDAAAHNERTLKYLKCQQANQEANEVYYRNQLSPPTTRAGSTIATLSTVTSSLRAANACN